MQPNITDPSENGLSKSQKKRMKQKAARLRREAKEAPVAAPLRPANKGSLNSSENLREDLKQMGYSYEEIDKTMEEMWNLQLQYDDVESVLAYIRSRNLESEANNQTADEGTSMSTASSNNLTTGDADLQAATGSVSVASLDPIQPADEKGASSKSIIRKSEPEEDTPMTLKERLSMVANFENLTDAIVALTEWITKAANATQIEEMCSACSSNALRIVIERSILDLSTENGLLLNLIGVILKSSGLPQADVSTSAKQLTKILNQAQMATKNADTATAANFATNVAFVIVKTISKQLKELQYSTQSGASKIRQLEKEIERLASTMVGNGSNKPKVVELMTKRDTLKAAAEKYSSIMNITMLNIFIESGQDPDKISTSTLDNAQQRDNLVASIMGHDSDEAELNRVKYDSLKTQLAQANSPTHNQRDSLSTELDACEKQRQDLSDRIQLLKLEIQKLEQEDLKIKNRMLEIDSQMATLLGSQSSDIRDLEKELTETSKLIKLEENTKSIVDMLHKFETNLVSASSSTCSKETNHADFNPGTISRKIGIYIVRMMNYFNSEAEMVNFLKSRVALLESQIPSLQFEIDECQGLQMTANVAQMTKTLNETRKNISDDKELISTLQREAETMRDELMKFFIDFKKGLESNGTSSGLISIHTSMLKGIKDAMLRIGLSNDAGLTALFDTIVSNESTAKNKIDQKKPKKNVKKIDNKANQVANGQGIRAGKVVTPDPVSSKPISSDSSTATTSTSSSAPIPAPAPKAKIGWGMNATSQKPAAKSFLDIQKEELQMKE